MRDFVVGQPKKVGTVRVVKGLVSAYLIEESFSTGRYYLNFFAVSRNNHYIIVVMMLAHTILHKLSQYRTVPVQYQYQYHTWYVRVPY